MAPGMPLPGRPFRRWVLVCLIGCWMAGGSSARAAGPYFPVGTIADVELRADTVHPAPHTSRGLAVALALTLGPFGGHRLYLGTKPKVPLIYSVTFGGFGVLVVIDIGQILFTKDLSRFQGSDRVFMWGKGGDPTPP